MATIRNKAELVRRAEYHRREDRFVQGTYSDFMGNGDVKFKGCAIGCLATPHTQSGLRKLFETLLPEGRRRLGIAHAEENAHTQLKRLRAEFGVSVALARLMEDVFERETDNDRAANATVRMVRALPEGVDIRGQDVKRFVEAHGGMATGWRRPLGRGYAAMIDWSVESGEADPIEVKDVVRWLRSLDPTRRVKVAA